MKLITVDTRVGSQPGETPSKYSRVERSAADILLFAVYAIPR
jgi:hypothetical protein